MTEAYISIGERQYYMEQSRTENVLRNATLSIICQIISLLLSFASRTIFIKTLGVEYLGVNGLFSNILTVLSFAELGIGSAITYSLYKPLATNDNKKTASLMLLYKKAYTTLGLGCIIAGLCVIPFLKIIIKNPIEISENITLLYILYLLNTGISYIMVYKKSILIADQKSYVVLFLDQIINIIHFLVNVLVLFLTKNFILYLILNIFFTIISNLIAAVIANKKYPYLKEKAVELNKEEKHDIFRNVKSLAVYKFGSVIVNGTDNILISSLVGVTQVGFVSNYTLITTSCNTLLAKIEEAFMASVGNLNVASDKEKKYDVFQKMVFITFWIYGFTTCGLVLLLNPFIELWIGKEYCLSNLVVIAICLELYTSGMHNPAYIFRTTLGLFKQGGFSAILASILNISLSIILFRIIGLPGIFLATSIAKFFSYGIVDPVLIYKRAFNVPVKRYYLEYLKYSLILFAICYLLDNGLTIIPISGVIGFVMKFAFVCVAFNILVLVIFGKTNLFRELLIQIKNIMIKKFNRTA